MMLHRDCVVCGDERAGLCGHQTEELTISTSNHGGYAWNPVRLLEVERAGGGDEVPESIHGKSGERQDVVKARAT